MLIQVNMVLIDSSTDLMATASRQHPIYLDYAEAPLKNDDVYDIDNFSTLKDIYLNRAYEKRVQDLEDFARDKNFWSNSKETDLERNGNLLSKRRQRIGAKQQRRRILAISQRRKDFDPSQEPQEESKVGIYDYVDPLSFSDIYSSPSNFDEKLYSYGDYGRINFLFF